MLNKNAKRWLVAVSAVLGLSLVAIGSYRWKRRGLLERFPEIQSCPKSFLQNPSVILDAKGRFISELHGVRNRYLPLEEIPRVLQQAFVANEDRDFFRHSGTNLMGVIRAAYKNLLAGRFAQGGSTLTQQVVRIQFGMYQKTLGRKLDEYLLAREMEKNCSKNQILEFYLNNVYLGYLAYGVEAASWVYFAKPLKDLNLEELTLIAGLGAAPSRYNPYTNLKSARARQRYTLKRLREEGHIDLKQAESTWQKSFQLSKVSRFYRDENPDLTVRVLNELDGNLRQQVISGEHRVDLFLDSAENERFCQRHAAETRRLPTALFRLQSTWQEREFLVQSHRELLRSEADGVYDFKDPGLSTWVEADTPLRDGKDYFGMIGETAESERWAYVGTRRFPLDRPVDEQKLAPGSVVLLRFDQSRRRFSLLDNRFEEWVGWDASGRVTGYCRLGARLQLGIWRQVFATLGITLTKVWDPFKRKNELSRLRLGKVEGREDEILWSPRPNELHSQTAEVNRNHLRLFLGADDFHGP